MKIGYLFNTYPYERNIIDKVKGIEYKKIPLYYDYVRDFLLIICGICRKIHVKYPNRLQNRLDKFCYSGALGVDIIHSFNMGIDTKSSYVVTFETSLPRMQELLSFHHENSRFKMTKQVKRAIYLLSLSNCKKIIAMSESARDIFKATLHESGLDKELEEVILNKTIVIHPPQKTLVTHTEIMKRYQKIEKWKFIFIGKDFFRKGGKELLEALSPYKDKCELYLISEITYGDYASYSTKEEAYSVEEYISHNKEWIKYWSKLDNEKVLELCQKVHIGLLPTFADTYGYSCLEMQAAGLPVISTDVRALKEINDDQCGWIIHLPQNQFGEALYGNNKSRMYMKKILKSGLDEVLYDIFCNNEVENVEKKAHFALNRIIEVHSPEEYGSKLKKIYENC